MINVSNAFKEKLEAGEPVRMMVDITFPDGTKKTIDKDVMNGDNGFSDCADSSSFPIGATVCKTLTLSINNDQEQWKNYNFYGAKIHAYLKLQTSYAAPESVSTLLDESYDPILDSTGDPIIATQAATKDIIETIDKGVYTVTTPEQYSDIINVTALDDMYKANKTYTSGLKLPQSLINLVRDACKTVGIGMNLTMDHGDIIIRSVPDSMTFRQLFGYAAMVESANARIDYSGNLQFVKWDFGKMESDNAATVDADGFIHFGDASPSIDTDGFVSLPGWTINAEGFLALTSGPGSDVQRLMAYANPPALSSDDIVITGIKVTNGQSNDDTDTDYSGMYGEEGYVLELENELIDTDQLQTVANIIGEQIVGARFRNLEGDLVYNPLVEFGDMVYTYDRLGNKYLTPLTDVSGNVGGLTTVKTQADDPIRGSSNFYSDSTKAIVAARKMVKKETSAREEAMQKLNDRISNASGMYSTDVQQADGSVIRYLHDKKTLGESLNVIKITSDAIGFSTDGGKTFPYGVTVDGETITRLLYAEGINADYINAGTLIVRDKSGNAIFEADMDTGSVTLDGSYVTIGGKPLDEKIEDVENMAALARNMTIQLDNDYQGIPVDSDGNYTEFPECTTTATVMYGSQDITDDCTYTITKSENVQGRWKDDTHTYTVTALTADSGWVDIRAAYLNNLVISKRFSLAKQYAGKNGIDGLQGIQGEKGEQGIPGKDGTNGTDGKTSYFHIKYSSVSNPTSSGQMTEAPSAYIGTYVDFTEADSNDPKKYTWSKFEGKDGEDGIPGANGADGKTYYLHIAYANSADGKTDFSTSNSTNKSYIGQYTDTTQADSTNPTKYSWTKIKGDSGVAGRTYFLQPNAELLLMGADKKISPVTLTINAFYRDGQEEAKALLGYWKVEKSSDGGNTYSEISTAYTMAAKTINIAVNTFSLEAHDIIRVSVYADKSKTTLYDRQSFSVAVDVAALTQEQIVDILSNNGTWKGLYYLNNHLYISFDAAKGGTLALGGANNGNGQLKIYDADGNQISRLGYTGYVVLNKNTGNPMVSLNTAGLRLYTDYTDADNYNALMLGKYGLYAQKVQNNVPELWMEGTDHTWDGYIIRYLKNKVRINTNSLFTDGCELGANFSTDGSATIGKSLSVGGNATVDGTLMFYDLENQAKTSGKVKRQPVASVSADDSQVAYLFSGTGSKHGDAATYRRLGIRAKWGGSGFSTDYLYTTSQVSDIRLKENIESSETDALETVNRMKVRQFDWKERMGGWHQNIGFVADELEEIDPNLALGGGYDENGEMDVKQINSPYLLNYAIKAIQELSAKVDEQEKRIKELERRLQ